MAGLIGIAVVAVIVGLVSNFNNVVIRELVTITMVALHGLLGFSYITSPERREKRAGVRSTELFSNTVFALIAVSFITSLFATWQLLGDQMTFKLYLFYGVVLFATLHADALYRLRGFDKKIDQAIVTNYLFMAVVAVMLTILIFASSSYLGTVFYRVLAAMGIIDATTTIAVVVMHKMYLQRHPELAAQAARAAKAQLKNFWKNLLVTLLLVFVILQIILGAFWLIASLTYYLNMPYIKEPFIKF